MRLFWWESVIRTAVNHLRFERLKTLSFWDASLWELFGRWPSLSFPQVQLRQFNLKSFTERSCQPTIWRVRRAGQVTPKISQQAGVESCLRDLSQCRKTNICMCIISILFSIANIMAHPNTGQVLALDAIETQGSTVTSWQHHESKLKRSKCCGHDDKSHSKV